MAQALHGEARQAHRRDLGRELQREDLVPEDSGAAGADQGPTRRRRGGQAAHPRLHPSAGEPGHAAGGHPAAVPRGRHRQEGRQLAAHQRRVPRQHPVPAEGRRGQAGEGGEAGEAQPGRQRQQPAQPGRRRHKHNRFLAVVARQQPVQVVVVVGRRRLGRHRAHQRLQGRLRARQGGAAGARAAQGGCAVPRQVSSRSTRRQGQDAQRHPGRA